MFDYPYPYALAFLFFFSTYFLFANLNLHFSPGLMTFFVMGGELVKENNPFRFSIISLT